MSYYYEILTPRSEAALCYFALLFSVSSEVAIARAPGPRGSREGLALGRWLCLGTAAQCVRVNVLGSASLQTA